MEIKVNNELTQKVEDIQLNNNISLVNIIDLIRPIGSLYWSENNTNPSTIYPGTTWVQITDKFIVAAGSTYKAGSSYGAASHTHTSAAHTHTVNGHTHTSAAHSHSTGNHTLTIAEMPSHTHWTREIAPGLYAGWGNKSQDGWITQSLKASNGGTWETAATGGGGAHNHGNTGSTTPGATGSTSLTTNSTTPGNTGSSSNIPPSVAMYCWKRTA